jgi:integrase
MYPFGEQDLERVYATARNRDERLADLLLIASWTGLRWSELRAIRVRDFIEVPMPTLVVQRAEPEGVDIKSTKSGKSRRVPVADRILPLVRAMSAGRDADEPLFVTATGHRLHASAFKRTLNWSTVAEGRRIHDLRHTAACLWLAHGVDPVTVQAWMGHASIATTNLYLHHLGTGADRAGLARLNEAGRDRATDPGHNGGTNLGGATEQHE